LFPGQSRVHPRLRTGLSFRGGEIQDPILFHKLIAEIKLHALDCGQEAVIGFDAVGPDQQKQVGVLFLVTTPGRNQPALAVDLPLDLGENVTDGNLAALQNAPLRVKDQGVRGTLHIDRLAVFSPAAPVGNQGIGLLIATTKELQVLQRLFEAVQLLGQAQQLFLGGLLVVNRLGSRVVPDGQQRAALAQAGFLRPELSGQVIRRRLFPFQVLGLDLSPVLHRPNAAEQLIVLLG
jgi:hypothetical protein